MANDFDEFPYYDPLTKNNKDKMSDIWITAMSSFLQTLIGYLTQFGIFLPQVTTTQRDSIQSPVNGQIIYNTTLNSAQYFKNGTWTSI